MPRSLGFHNSHKLLAGRPLSIVRAQAVTSLVRSHVASEYRHLWRVERKDDNNKKENTNNSQQTTLRDEKEKEKKARQRGQENTSTKTYNYRKRNSRSPRQEKDTREIHPNDRWTRDRMRDNAGLTTTQEHGENTNQPQRRSHRRESEENWEFAREEKHPTITFIGDEQFSNIAEDQNLNITAWRRMWRIRLTRGGRIQEVRRMIHEVVTNEEKSRTAVISMGGNDFAEIKRERTGRQEAEERIANMIEETARGIKELHDAGYAIGVIRVPPRKDVLEEDRKNYNQQLYRRHNRIKGITLIDIQDTMKAGEYIQEILTDGKQIKKERWNEILQQILHEIEEETSLPTYPGPIPKRLYLDPTKCWKCGNNHSKERGCRSKDLSCNRCDSYQHNPTCCPLRVILCSECGSGGHSKKVCM